MFRLRIQDYETNKLLISEEDDYIRHVTPEYISYFTGNDKTSRKDFQNLLEQSVVKPKENFHYVLNRCEQYINNALSVLGIELFMTVNIIPTDGTDNIALPYTKGNSLIIPTAPYYNLGKIDWLSTELTSHELWHILSRNNPDLRKTAYQLFGFLKAPETLNPLENPFLLRRYFINPDAIFHDYYFPISIDRNQTFYGFPMLLDRSFTPSIVIFDNDYYLYDIWETSKTQEYNSYFPNISYNYHVEEICAEHFLLLIKDCHTPTKDKIPDPDIIRDFEQVIQSFFK